MNYRGYKELKCYIEALLLRVYISSLSQKFPATEKFAYWTDNRFIKINHTQYGRRLWKIYTF